MWLDVRPDHPVAICSTRRGETEDVLVGFAESAPGGIRVFLALCGRAAVCGTVGASLEAARAGTRPEMDLIPGVVVLVMVRSRSLDQLGSDRQLASGSKGTDPSVGSLVLVRSLSVGLRLGVLAHTRVRLSEKIWF